MRTYWDASDNSPIQDYVHPHDHIHQMTPSWAQTFQVIIIIIIIVIIIIIIFIIIIIIMMMMLVD